MFRIPVGLTPAVLAVAALAPAVASAADIQLGGAPTLRRVDARHATLSFAADRLPRRADGTIDARITFAGDQRVSALRSAGRHGNDVVYTARVTSQDALRVGTKYTVRFRFAGQAPIERKVKLHAASG